MKINIEWDFKKAILVVAAAAVGGAALVAITVILVARELPQFISVSEYKPLGVTQVLYQDPNKKKPQVLAEFYKERRYLVPIEKIPDQIIKAFVSAEDDNFFQHQGISLVSIARAAIVNFFAGQMVQGGSTITQQVAKSLFLSPERNIMRKIREVILASRLEKNLSKQQILYLYLNQIYLGHGAYGIEAAARAYFRKGAQELSLAESALLAGLPKAPSKFAPFSNPKRAKERQLYVLKRMVETGAISEPQRVQAAAQPLKLYFNEEFEDQDAAYLIENLRRNLVQKYSEKSVYEDGLTVWVSTPPELQTAARKALQFGLREVEKRRGFRGPVRTITAPEEVSKFIEESDQRILRKKSPLVILQPDESLSAPRPEGELLDQGVIYEGLVRGFDEKKKAWKVNIGSKEVRLYLADAEWAKPVLSVKPLRLGDVVLVQLFRKEPDSWAVSLEQKPEVQGALFSIEIETGRILAMVGGYDFRSSEFNRANQAKRQPGSAIKPLIYAAAVERGFTPASVIVDAPIVYDDKERGKWKPTNYEEKFYGDTTFRQALINSRNIPTIKILESVEVANFISFAKRIGWEGDFPPDLSISLGSALTTLQDLVKIYSVFPRYGKVVQPSMINRVFDRDGKLLEQSEAQTFPDLEGLSAEYLASPAPDASASPEQGLAPRLMQLPQEKWPGQVMDPRTAYVMTHLMKEVVTFGTGRRATGLGRPAAGKTGTTNDNKDAWFMGFTPTVATGVWVGFDDLQSMNSSETGANAALPIWLQFMQEAVKNLPPDDFKVPPGITMAWIDSKTGRPAKAKSAGAIEEAFISGTEPVLHQGGVSQPDTDSQNEFLKEDYE